MSSKKKSTLPDHPLKVLMLAPTPYFSDRGCHVRIFEEAKALHYLGVDVRIITYHLGRDIPPIPTYRICSIPWYNKREAGPSWHKPYLDMLLFFRALQIAKTFRPDIIHGHLHEGALIGFLLKRWLKVPLLFDYQGSLTGEIAAHGFVRRGSLLHRFFAYVENAINRGADLIVTSSSPSAASLVNDWQVQASSVATVIDGVDTESCHQHDKNGCRNELNLPLGVPMVGFLGLLNEYQGVDILLDAVSILKKNKWDIHFLIMGFPEKKYIEKSRELGVQDLVTFTGRIAYETASIYLSACDIAVSPKISLTEANGKLFNYMACGLPTVVFDTPVNREILGNAGVYAEYGNAADLAHKIVSLLGDEGLLKHLAGLMLEKACRDHSWRSRGKSLSALYRKVVQGN